MNVLWKFVDEGDNPVNNPSIYNVEEDNRLSPSLQPLTIGTMLNIFQSVSVIVFSMLEIILFSSAKTKHSSHKHLRVVSV